MRKRQLRGLCSFTGHCGTAHVPAEREGMFSSGETKHPPFWAVIKQAGNTKIAGVGWMK